jgi:hypothetical protein
LRCARTRVSDFSPIPRERRSIDGSPRLIARPLLEGYRGAEPVDIESLTRLLVRFSDVVMDLEEMIESIDLNPVMCKGERCIVADARIMPAKG